MSIRERFTDEPLWLMDGSAFVYRGFFANQGMTRSDGMLTGAIFIVARILLRILRDERPRHLVFMLDGHGPNFRHEAFPPYKANRDATPESLIQQMEPIQRLIRALGIPLEISSGCEADDCIASLAARYREQRPVVIIGTDKDLRQCLHPQVMMWDPAAKNEKIITLDSFVAESGLRPEQWPDLQALVGDTSDNIPGIHGIGPKTAEKILRVYPNLEAIREHVSELAANIQAKFLGKLDDMFLYRTLTRLRVSCCEGLELDAMRVQPVKVEETEALLREFELPSLQRELSSMLRAGVLEAAPTGGESEREAVHGMAANEFAELWSTDTKPSTLNKPFLPGASGRQPSKAENVTQKAERSVSSAPQQLSLLDSGTAVPVGVPVAAPGAAFGTASATASTLGTPAASLDVAASIKNCGKKDCGQEYTQECDEREDCTDAACLPASDGMSVVLLCVPDDAVLGDGISRDAASDDIAVLVGIGQRGLRYSGTASALCAWLEQAKQVIVPDLKSLWRRHPLLRRVPMARWFDLGLAAYLCNPEEADVSWSRLLARYNDAAQPVAPDSTAALSVAVRMRDELVAHLQAGGLHALLTELEMPLIPVLADMEAAGVCLDQQALSVFLHDIQQELASLTQQIYTEAGESLHAQDSLGASVPFNIRSSQQLAALLFDRLGLPRSGKTRGGQARTDQEALEKLQGKHPIIDVLLAYRKKEKMRSTYLEPLPRLMDADGRIRTSFNQTATATGRLSSSNPNLQNIPIRGELGRRMRSCFTAAPGNQLISADYSQIELRVLAHLSQEPTLLEAFREGADIHARTAGLLFNRPPSEVSADERRNAKTINFGLIYGMGPQSLAKSLGITLNEAKVFIEQYFTHLSHLKLFYDNVEQLAREQGFVLTLTGRRRLLPDIHSESNQIRSQARRQAINTMVQGSAADIIKLAMLAVHHDKPLHELKARLLLQVHDELLLEVPTANAAQAAARVASLMAAVRPGGVQLDVPLTADAGVGDNWGAAH